MALATTAYLGPHFTAGELGADLPGIPSPAVLNLYAVVAWLEAARAVLGVPLRVTSGWRSGPHNAQVGGAADSDHLVGLAADFEPVGLTPYEAYRRLQAAQAVGTLPVVDQLIFYSGDDHIHVGLGKRRRGEVLVSLSEGSYTPLVGELVTRLRGYV